MTMSEITQATVESREIATASQYAVAVRKAPAPAPLSEGEAARARELAAGLVPTDERLGDVVRFGSDVQASLAKISKGLLAGVRVNTLDDVLRLSDNVLEQVNQVHLDGLSPI